MRFTINAAISTMWHSDLMNTTLSAGTEAASFSTLAGGWSGVAWFCGYDADGYVSQINAAISLGTATYDSTLSAGTEVASGAQHLGGMSGAVDGSAVTTLTGTFHRSMQRSPRGTAPTNTTRH